MAISKNFSSVHEQHWTINFLQCGPNGKIRITDFCHLLQLTAHEHSVLGGLSFDDMQVFDQAWVLSNFYLEIEELPKKEETIVIKTWIVSMEGNQSLRALEVWQNDKKISGAITLWVVLNTKIRKPEKLALPFEHFQLFPSKLPTKKPLEKIRVLNEYDTYFTQNVKISDLDLVNHVNNVKYIEWCLDTISLNYLNENSISEIQINFLREMHWNQNFRLHQKKENRKFYFAISTEKTCCLLNIAFH
jgi:acyl-ACP thioesterase